MSWPDFTHYRIIAVSKASATLSGIEVLQIIEL